MKSNRFLQHRFIFFSLLFTILATVALCLGSCSAQKKYGQTIHKNSRYKDVRVKQPRWNTATSTSTTYYIRKQTPRKRYNP